MDIIVGDEIIFTDNVLQIISARYKLSKYYTWADSVLISLNPFTSKPEDKEARSGLKDLLKSKDICDTCVPHIYSVAHRAYYRLIANGSDQIIVISGDSGSGKTFSTQLALDYLADKNTSLGQIHDALVLLNALSNAGTEYHSDSSRVSKLVSLGYSEHSGQIVSAKLDTYLLEKTRVSSPSVRNFHVFYQLVLSRDFCKKHNLHLLPDCEYRILPGKSAVVNVIPLGNTLKALKSLQFKDSGIQGLFTVLAVILHLGNINFVLGENGIFRVERQHDDCILALQYASELLGLDPDCLEFLLTYNVISTESSKSLRHSTYHTPVATLTDVVARRDSLMKFLYTVLFNWVVLNINSVFEKAPEQATRTLGLLDIYGFEMFSRNSLEQLCINYVNECLHQHFIQDILVQKNMMLVNEGVLSKHAPKLEEEYLKDMDTRICLLHAPFSLFGIINEASLLSRHSSGNEYLSGKDLCHRITTLPKNKFISTNVHEQKFTFVHFAGSIKYDARHMVSKNCDKIPNEIINVLMTSSNRFLVKLLIRDETHVARHTVLSKFKSSLDSLIRHLRTAEVQYVRCIKTNIQMKPGYVDGEFLERQLQSSGILEAVKLCGHCYLMRLSFADFIGRYSVLIPNYKLKCSNNVEVQKRVIRNWMKDMKMECQLGDASVFIKENASLMLDLRKKFFINRRAGVIQKWWRHFRNLKEERGKRLMFEDAAAKIIQKYVRKFMLLKKEKEKVNITDDSGVVSEPEILQIEYPPHEVETEEIITAPPVETTSDCSCSVDWEYLKRSFDELNSLAAMVKGRNHITKISNYSLSRDTHITGHFLKKIKVSKFFCGDQIYFVGNGVVSRRALVESPIWFHTRTPLTPSLNIEPYCITPKGIEDAFA